MSSKSRAKLAVFTYGLWRLRDELSHLGGRQTVYYPGFMPAIGGGDLAIGGWGHKPTARRARAIAARKGLDYIAFEDGFLRSVEPGAEHPPLSMVMDKSGIYYDARQPSDLETMLAGMAQLDDDEAGKARAAIDVLRRRRLSKYNDAAPRARVPGLKEDSVLVIDQTYGDASVAGGLSGPDDFAAMLDAALAENPGRDVYVKTHPEVIAGTKKGYLGAAGGNRAVKILDAAVNPWELFETPRKVYTVSSQLGFEALMAGCKVVCFGAPFYAGWGLSDDRKQMARRGRKLSVEQMVHAVYFRYCHYFDAWRRTPVDFFTACEQLAFLRDEYHANNRPVCGYRISLWKRPAVKAMLGGRAREFSWYRRADRALAAAGRKDARLVAWGQNGETLRKLGACGVMTMEDGFLRSVGLGASFTPSASYVFDDLGIYFDPSRPSRLVEILNRGGFDERQLARAAALRQRLVAGGFSKYNLGGKQAPGIEGANGRKIVLVPGQVADDQSVIRGGAGVFDDVALDEGGVNLGLLRAVRERNEDAFIIYKPHPDVTAGLRRGRIDEAEMTRLASLVVHDGSITQLLDVADSVETLTSLTGFEALMRGVPVVVHGRPFYAGWGLSTDLAPMRFRERTVTLDELVCAALVIYPHYFDRKSGLVCPPEVVLDRFEEELQRTPGLAARAGRSLAHGLALGRYGFLRARARFSRDS